MTPRDPDEPLYGANEFRYDEPPEGQRPERDQLDEELGDSEAKQREQALMKMCRQEQFLFGTTPATDLRGLKR